LEYLAEKEKINIFRKSAWLLVLFMLLWDFLLVRNVPWALVSRQQNERKACITRAENRPLQKRAVYRDQHVKQIIEIEGFQT
jgi:hypothetical protein